MSAAPQNPLSPVVEPVREAEFLQLLLQHLPISVSILDSGLNYRLISNATYEFLDINPNDLKVGDHLSDCHRLMKANGLLNDDVVQEKKLSDADLNEQNARSSNAESQLVRLGNGSTHRLLRKPLDNGHTLSIATDVTELVEKDQILEEALNLGLSGYWVYDFATKSYSLSNSLKKYFTPEDVTAIENGGFQAIVNDADRPHMKEELSKMVENGDRFEFEVRTPSAFGHERWSRTNGELIRDNAGRPLKIRAFVHDITREIRQQEELSRIKDEAVAASRAKSEFLANMSHEIRTPMNGVLGMAELLAGSNIDDRQREYVNVINNSATALLNIINDILDFSKIEAGALEIDPIPFDLKASISDVAALLVASAQDKGLELIINYDSALPKNFIGDAGRIRQITTNLVSNAIKFTHEGHVSIDVTMDTQSDIPQVRLAVRDTGIGIEREKLDRIFEKFTQADNSTTRLYGGTGLGLTISKRIAEMMGGTMNVDSTVGEGSTFAVEIPLPLDKNAKEERFDTDMIRNRRVLIIDDIDVNCMVLSRQVENWEMSALCAHDAMEGIAKLSAAQDRGEPFDLILLDFLMPGLNGRELATLLQDRSDLDVPPIIMLSSCDQAVSSADLARIGIDSYLVKPVRERRLYETIVRTLSNRAATPSSPPLATPTPAKMAAPASAAVAPPPVIEPAPEPATQSAPQAAPPAPRPRPAPVLRPLTDANPAANPFADHLETVAATIPVQDPAQTAMASETGRKQEILVAEDFPLNQDVVRLMLSETQFIPVFADNGQKAVEAYTHEPHRFPAIIMDVSMPIMDGYEATRKIRAWEDQCGVTEAVPIIALTGHALKNDRGDCLAAGMDDYLTKPVKQIALLEALERYTGRVVGINADPLRAAS